MIHIMYTNWLLGKLVRKRNSNGIQDGASIWGGGGGRGLIVGEGD